MLETPENHSKAMVDNQLEPDDEVLAWRHFRFVVIWVATSALIVSFVLGRWF